MGGLCVSIRRCIDSRAESEEDEDVEEWCVVLNKSECGDLIRSTTTRGTRSPGLNEALLVEAVAAKLVRTDKVRADTTVVEANVAYRTDLGAVGQGGRRYGSHCGAGQSGCGGEADPGARPQPRCRPVSPLDRVQAALRGQHNCDQAQAVVRRITGEPAGIAQQTMRDAAAVIRNAERALRIAAGPREDRLHRAINDLTVIVERSKQVMAQTRDKLKWPTGSEGRINHIKRSYGWNCTELTGIADARTWRGHGSWSQPGQTKCSRRMKPTDGRRALRPTITGTSRSMIYRSKWLGPPRSTGAVHVLPAKARMILSRPPAAVTVHASSGVFR